MSDSPSQSRPWLVRKRQKDNIHDKKARPKPSYIPTIGKQRNKIAEGASADANLVEEAGAWHTMWLGWTLIIFHRKANKNSTWSNETEILEVT